MKNLLKYYFCLLLFFPGFLVTYGQLNTDFSVSATSGCTPLNIQFKDLSTGNPTQWIWDFGNGTTSTLQNPTVTYVNKGNYTVRLIIKNASGENYIEKQNYITVSATPDVEFTQDKNSGCAPLSVTFQNNTSLFGSGIKSWLWNFGDGITSNQQNISHVYSKTGVFNVTLTAQTISGCSNTLTVTNAVATGNLPASVSFKANPLDGCASTLRNFTGLSSVNVNSWNWDFGDGGTSSLKNPSYHYTDTGWFSVKLKAGYNGCDDSVTYSRFIHINGPTAKIYRNIDCLSPYKIQFYASNNGAQNWFWDFGDGTTSTSRIITHTYKTSGIFNTKLTVSTASCTDTISTKIYIVQQKPLYKVIPLQKKYCKYDTVEFITTNYDSLLTYYCAWSFDNGLTKTAYSSKFFSIQHVYSAPGAYSSPLLYIVNREGCFDTIHNSAVNINITGASPDFKNSLPDCVGSNIIFSDQSTLVNNSPVKQWKWNFNDGDSLITSAAQINYKFPFPGLYNVLLNITDADGCSDTITHTINISDNPVINAGSDTFICAGKSLNLKPTGGTSYTWDNNMYLSCTNCTNPVATPLDTTRFFVTGKNAAGCTARDTIKINVQQQETLTVQPLTDTICAGNLVQLMASGYDSYKWQPVSGLNNANIANPLASPLNNTVYTVTATDKSGCFSKTGSINIIANPKPSVTINKEVTLQPGALYQIKPFYSADVVKWQWQPSQWLNDPTIANPVAQPLQNITYTVYAATASGCVTIDSITIYVLCNKSVLFIPNTFSPNGDGVNDYFFPRSKVPVTIKNLRIFNRWGQEVFNKSDFVTNDENAGWNGKYKGSMQQADVYVYIMQIACENGSVFNSQGSISLIR